MSKPDSILYALEWVSGEAPASDQTTVDGYDLSFLLPSSFRSVEMWATFMEAVANVFNTHLHIPASALAEIRIPEAQSRVYKALHSHMMGYELPSEIMTDDSYDRLNNHIGYYQEAQGRDSFLKFLAYVLGVKLDIVRLWTQDYKTFMPGHGVTVFEGGTWYPTTHVGVVFDDKGKTHITDDIIMDLFYSVAPCDLVLKWIAKSITITLPKLYIGLLALEDISFQFRLNARDDLALRITLHVLSAIDAYFRFDAVAGRGAIDMGLDLNNISMYERTTPLATDGILWRKTDELIPSSSRLSFSRASEAWLQTGAGTGAWVASNTPRYYAANPIDGSVTGLLMERDTVNYVRSSTQVGSYPWIVDKSLTVSMDYFGNPDGSDAIIWRTPSTPLVINQAISLEAGTYTAQIWCKGGTCLPSISTYLTGLTHILGPSWPAFTSTVMAGGWTLMTSTFTTTETLNHLIELSVKDTSVFYVGIEPGYVATSPIRTGDCEVGVRAADNLMLRVNGELQGTVAFNTIPFTSMYDIIDPAIANLMRARGSEDEYATLTSDAFGNKTYSIIDARSFPVHQEELLSPASATNTVYLSWDSDTTTIGLDGSTVTIPASVPAHAVYLGPRWIGYITGFMWAPHPVTPALCASLGV